MPWGRWRRWRQRQESTSLLTKVFSAAGCRTCEWPSGSPTTGSDIHPETAPPSRRDLRAQDRCGTSTCQPDPGVWQNRPGRVAGAAPGAREMAEGSLPHQHVCSRRWGGPRSEKACSPPRRTDPIIAVQHSGSRLGEWCSKAAGPDVTSATAGLMIVGLFQQSDEGDTRDGREGQDDRCPACRQAAPR
jgi:hypothetical protein